MIALIWMLTWLPQVLPAMSELPPPVNLTLTSDHFIHILKWASAPGTPTGVYYQVDISKVTGTFHPVAGCERVQHPLVCNLTEAFSKYEEVYFTRVTARLETQTSQPSIYKRFQPIKDTRLDLPLLTVTPCNRSLCVDLQPHMEHLRERYNLLKYELRIQNRDTDRDKFIGNIKPLSRKILTDLVPGREYCVSVRFFDNLIHRNSSYSQPQCAFAPDVYPADALISGVVCSLVMCGVVVLGLLGFTGFICLKRRPLPAVLTSIRHLEEVLVIQLRNPSFSPLSNIRATLPSSGGKRSSQTPSDESDGESDTENTAGSKGGGYKLRGGTNLLSASSSSSTSSSAPSPSLSSNPKAVLLPPDFFSPQPEAQISAPNPTYMASLSDSLPESVHSPPADTDSSTVERDRKSVV